MSIDYYTPEPEPAQLDVEVEALKAERDTLRAEVERLRTGLATALGTRTHGMNMTWEERIRIARAALDGQPAPGKEDA